MKAKMGPIIAFLLVHICILEGAHSAQYFGKFLGKLSELHHGVSGEVYAVDGRTLYIKDFTYDGQGPAAYFYASASRNADRHGFRLRDENGSPEVIRRYRKEGLTLTLPEGKTLHNIKIFYVWCEEFEVNFGDVKIPRNFDYPRPQKIDPLKGVHSISSDNIVIVDAQTLLIPNLSYDGEAPDAKFWVGRGTKPSPQGIRVPDENGKEIPLRRYNRKTVVLTLPGDLTVFDIGHFGIWCEAFTVDFGHVQIPSNLNIPPSLKMLGISPQSKLNCEVLYDDLAFEIRWAVAGDSIVMQLVSKLDDREYMSFGLSGDDSKSVMIGGDVVVAWVDKETLKGYAEDYYLDAKSQCSGPSGSCPDKHFIDNTNNIRLLNAAMVNGYSIVTYQRPLKANDEFDRPIYTNHSQPIIWAIGPLNQKNEVSFHSHYTKGDRFIDFGRPAKWNCPMPESEQPSMRPLLHKEEIVTQSIPATTITTTTTTIPVRSRNSERRRGSNRARQETTIVETTIPKSTARQRQRGNTRNNIAKPVPTPAPVAKRNAWDIPPIQCYEPEDGVFYAQMGPTGGKRGYPAITGHVGWGISWYINGLLIPEINVVRGKTYTFVVEGGQDPEIAAKYHPFYITDDPVGGYEYKTEEEKKNVRIFAGATLDKDGKYKPTGTGRLCHWTQQGDLDADDFESFGAYQRTLELKCDQGEPGVIQWTPDKDTPDTVYYHCFTHRYLGWKINVHDSCDIQSASSEIDKTILPAPDNLKSELSDLEPHSSVRVETRVKPNKIIDEAISEDNKNQSIVSETKTDSPVTDPSSVLYRQPQLQLPNVPILIQPQLLLQQQQQEQYHQPQQQQNYFNPPILMNHGPIFTTNPYLIEQPPFYINPYQQTFKPSPLIQQEQTHLELAPITSSISTTSSTSTSTKSTTSNTSTTTATTTTTTTEMPKISEKPKVFASKIHTNKTHYTGARLKMKNHNTYHYNVRNPEALHRPHPGSYKIMKIPPRLVPVRFRQPYKKPQHKSQIRPQLPPLSNNLKYISETRKKPNLQIVTTTTKLPILNKIVQIKTQKEIEIQTAPPSTLISLQPIKENYSEIYLKPALNTGFHPESLVIESGFKPIINKQFQRRVFEDTPETKPDIEIVTNRNVPQVPQLFSPIFVPSPTDKPLLKLKNKRPYIKKVIIKHERSLDETEEPLADAAEHVSYYLPPSGEAPRRLNNRTDIEPMAKIDLEPQSDIVVTYDGKRVSGSTLTVRNDRSNTEMDQGSKTFEFIQKQPQFVPFQGELPPLDINGNVKKLTRLERRQKRAAHHTPEHTAEQERLNQTNTTTTNNGNGGLKISLYTLVVAYFLKYI